MNGFGRKTRYLVALSLIAGLAVSCGQSQASKRGPSGNSPGGQESVENGSNGLAYDVAEHPDVCAGNLVPPTGYRAETAYVPLSTPNPFDAAATTARQRLGDMICVGQDDRCEEARSMVTIWRRGQDTRQACVMAIARHSDIQRFVAGPREQLRENLGDVAALIADRMRQEAGGTRGTVILDTIEDGGVNGGPRAEWMHRELLNALSQHPLDIREPPLGWSGLRAQSGTGIIRGELNSLPGAEGVLEISWRVHLDDNRRVGVGSVEFPEAILPELDRRAHVPRLPPSSDNVALHLDSRPGGGLCNGQRTELWLEAAEPLYVRVINVFKGGSAATVIYSTGSEKLPANQLVSLGQFDAVKSGDIPVERFLVVAAPTLEGLGNFASVGVDNFCRLPGSMAFSMHNGRDIPATAMDWFYSLDYQLMSGEECGRLGQTAQADLSFLNQIPTCW